MSHTVPLPRSNTKLINASWRVRSTTNRSKSLYHQNDIQNAFDGWLVQTFNEKARTHLEASRGSATTVPWELSDRTAHFEKHLYLVTVHFKHGRYDAKPNEAEYDTGPVFQAFKSWYLDVCRMLLSHRFTRMKKKQPFAMAFFDVEGTRHGRGVCDFQRPHIHASMLVHPSTAEKFQNLYEDGSLKTIVDPRLGTIDIKQFRDYGTGLTPMTTYAGKLAKTDLTAGRFSQTLQVFPDVERLHMHFAKSTKTH